MVKNDEKFLRLMAAKYPNIKAAAAEIINLSAILALPKGTEYYLSDLHGEHEAFVHMIKSGSGVIRSKIDELFSKEMSHEDRNRLSSLIYNADAEIKRVKKDPNINFETWCYSSIFRLIMVCNSCINKYTRSKVRKRLPKYWDYSIDELLHTGDIPNKGNYYSQIIRSIIETGMAETYIKELTEAMSYLCVDRLHIIGDVFDRGSHPDTIMDFLMTHEDVDIQWGNHDIVWMGAATGSWVCISNILRMNISYNNFDMLEIGYGINLRSLTSFANRVYKDDPCTHFMPKMLEKNKYDQVSEETAARMHKAIAIIQFKVEGQRIKAHPEYNLKHRLLLDKIDYEKGTIMLEGREYPLRDTNFPTIDPKDPYRLTWDEEKVMQNLEAAILNSKVLQRHIKFLFTHGALYKKANGQLLFHGCVPMSEDGEFLDCEIDGEMYKGKALFDKLDEKVRHAYYYPEKYGLRGYSGDIMWYMWLAANSPLFGKDKMTTFERLFVADKTTHKEHTASYYRFRDDEKICKKILAEFGLDPEKGHILNGHVPVKIKDGESPIKGKGKLFVIDGGISKAYQKQTGIAGYTFIYNSRFMALAEHKPYQPLDKNGNQEFVHPRLMNVENLKKRELVSDTDQAKELKEEIADLKLLLEAYRTGKLKQTF